MWAVRRGDISAARLLLEAKADPNAKAYTANHDTASPCAARSCNTAVIKLLLSAGADPSQAGMYTYNSLHHVVASADNKEAVENLLTAGMDIEGKNVWGATPLGSAVIGNFFISAEVLLDRGAETDAPDNQGDTPLFESLYYHSDDVTELLLKRGANYNLIDSAGSSVIHSAALSGATRTLAILQAACLKNVNPQALSPRGKTALQLAQQCHTKEEGFLEKFEELVTGTRDRNTQEYKSRERDDAVRISIKEALGNNFKKRTNSVTPNEVTIGPSTLSKWSGRAWAGPIRWRFNSGSLEDQPNRSHPMQVQSTWTSIIIYSFLGLGWAGLIYTQLWRGSIKPEAYVAQSDGNALDIMKHSDKWLNVSPWARLLCTRFWLGGMDLEAYVAQPNIK